MLVNLVGILLNDRSYEGKRVQQLVYHKKAILFQLAYAYIRILYPRKACHEFNKACKLFQVNLNGLNAQTFHLPFFNACVVKIK